MFYYTNENHLPDTATCLCCIILFYLNRVTALFLFCSFTLKLTNSSHLLLCFEFGGHNNGGVARKLQR